MIGEEKEIRRKQVGGKTLIWSVCKETGITHLQIRIMSAGIHFHESEIDDLADFINGKV